MNRSFIIFILIFLGLSRESEAQEILIYHGTSVEVLDAKTKNIFRKEKVIRDDKGSVIRIRILNPNMLFYNYEFKQEALEVKDEYPDVTDLITGFGNLLNIGSDKAGIGKTNEFADYKNMIEALSGEIVNAKGYLDKSDTPEKRKDAIEENETGGVSLARKNINDLPADKYHFNDPNLTANLDQMVMAIPGLDDISKQAFQALNANYVQKIKEIKDLISESNLPTSVLKEFAITGKKTKITLIISKKGSGGKARKVGEFEIATIAPYYERKTVELIPVANVLFAKNVHHFFLQDNIVRDNEKDTVRITPGLLLNVNLPPFGTEKEMAVGAGLGYSFSKNANFFNHLFISGIFSYRDFLRVGVGVGYSQVPETLTDGAKVNELLPSDITDLTKIVKNEAKLTGFLTISFTGLKLK